MDNDLISRQAAIDAIGKLSDEIYRTVEKGATFPTRGWFDGMAQAEHIVKNLPSVQLECKRGRFVGTEYDGYADGYPVYNEWECSECGCVFEDEEPMYNFCPNCGADMRGEQDE